MIDWNKIKKELQEDFASIKFELEGYEINVVKTGYKKGLITKGYLLVYIDGKIEGSWDKDNMPIITKAWCTTVTPMFRKKDKDEFVKKFGKRAAKNELINATHAHTSWRFLSLNKFMTQYKKLEKEDGLVLKDGFEDFLLSKENKVKMKEVEEWNLFSLPS
ncbi:MAG: hypothetical protein JXQ76_10905 [Campylobacterales bacterium]|nr:hypothetical protein [Campylobacterales bacterium]